MPDTSIPHLQSLDNLTNDISTPVLSGKNALRAVFKDHFNELPGLNLRPVVIKEIEKMINCQIQTAEHIIAAQAAITSFLFPSHANPVFVHHAVR